ncbi:hypothetical protein PV326_001727, partial [Microctonus aethiopoides]
ETTAKGTGLEKLAGKEDPVELDSSLALQTCKSGVRPRNKGQSPINILPRDPIRGHCQAGSLTGAVHLSKNNAGVLRPAQRGQKPRVEQKGKSWLDLDVQYA